MPPSSRVRSLRGVMVSFVGAFGGSSRSKKALKRAKRRETLLQALGHKPRPRLAQGSGGGENVDEYDDRRSAPAGAPGGDTAPPNVPSLLVSCAKTVLTHPELLATVTTYTPLSKADIFAIVQDASGPSGKDRNEMFTVTLRGCRLPAMQLQPEFFRRAQQVHFVVSVCLDDCIAANDSLMLVMCTDKEHGAKRLPLLQHMSLRSCPGVTDRGVRSIINTYGRQLLSLNISNTGTTQKAVKAIAAACPELHSLSLSHQLLVRDKHIALLAQHCGELRELDVSYCRRLGPASVEAIVSGFPFLHTLSLSDVPAMATSVEKLSRLERLRTLRLNNVPMGDCALMRILRGAPALDSLCLRGCTNLTLSAIRSIAAHCTGLRVLDITATGINGTLALGILAASPVAHSLREFSSTQRVIMYCTPATMKLFGTHLD